MSEMYFVEMLLRDGAVARIQCENLDHGWRVFHSGEKNLQDSGGVILKIGLFSVQENCKKMLAVCENGETSIRV